MLTIAILAGGMSQRMGRDKALMCFHGKPLICRVMERMIVLEGELFLVAPQTEDYLSLGMPVIQDLLPGRGVLGGFHTALISASQQHVAVVSCDAPFISPALIADEYELLASSDMDLVVPISFTGLEPLHGVYRSDTCDEIVRSALDAGERRMIGWCPRARVRYLEAQEIAVNLPYGRIFVNVNTPEEFARAEELAGEE